MGHQLYITAMGVDHPPFAYESLQEALEAAEGAIESRMFRFVGKEGGIAIQLGVGTVVKVRSDELILKEAAERQEVARNPLLIMASESPGAYKLCVTLGRAQLPAVGFPSMEDIDKVVDAAVVTGFFKHVFEEGHDYLYIFTGPGIVYITVTEEAYETQRRRAIEARVRAAQAAQTSAGERKGPVILGPGGRPH